MSIMSLPEMVTRLQKFIQQYFNATAVLGYEDAKVILEDGGINLERVEKIIGTMPKIAKDGKIPGVGMIRTYVKNDYGVQGEVKTDKYTQRQYWKDPETGLEWPINVGKNGKEYIAFGQIRNWIDTRGLKPIKDFDAGNVEHRKQQLDELFETGKINENDHEFGLKGLELVFKFLPKEPEEQKDIPF